MKLIEGKEIAAQIEKSLAKEIQSFTGRKPGLAFIRVGDNPSSKVYIGMKQKKCAEAGILSFDSECPQSMSQKDLLALIDNLNADDNVDGILLQLPIPAHLDTAEAIERIDPRKDVDGFHPYNMGKLLLGNAEGLIPCTPKGIHKLLIESGTKIEGKHVVIVGRSNIVGKPLAALLMQKAPDCNATVTVAHSRSDHLQEICKQADILVAAVGEPLFIKDTMVKKDAVVIDVGINKITKDGKQALVGDVDFEHVAPLCSAITPVPKGVGPMTIALLLENTVKAYKALKRF